MCTVLQQPLQIAISYDSEGSALGEKRLHSSGLCAVDRRMKIVYEWNSMCKFNLRTAEWNFKIFGLVSLKKICLHIYTFG
jgi:hypothetical protein